MRKLVLLLSIWSGTALSAPAAERKPFVMFQPPCPGCQSACPARDGTPCRDVCETCRKERCLVKLAKWLCYVPARTRCEKQPELCNRPPLYLYFTCCQPACGVPQPPPPGCVPALGCGNTRTCGGCR